MEGNPNGYICARYDLGATNQRTVRSQPAPLSVRAGFSLCSDIVNSLIIEIEPALLTGYLSNILAVSIHFFPTGNYHLTIHIANGVDNDMGV